MYLWNIKKLTVDLQKWLSEEENFKYIAMPAVVIFILLSITPNDNSFYWIILSFITILFSIISIFLFYIANWWNKWKNFLSRYFSISLVTTIRTSVFILLPIITIQFIILRIIYWIKLPIGSTIIDVISITIYLICYIIMNIKYLKLVNNNKLFYFENISKNIYINFLIIIIITLLFLFSSLAFYNEKENNSPVYEINYNYEKKTNIIDSIILKNIYNHSKSVEFNEWQFLTLLKNSLSLNFEEKRNIIDSIPKLNQIQIDELENLFKSENIKFNNLKIDYPNNIKDLEIKKNKIWIDLLAYYK